MYRCEPRSNKAKRSFTRISRRGFDEDALDDPEIVEGFALGAGALMAVDGVIATFADRLDALDRDTSLAHRLADDMNIFREQFAVLYGDRV